MARTVNGQLKPLVQEDYPLKLIKDLGRVKATTKSKQLRRFAEWECPICKQPFRSNVNTVKCGKVTKCKTCKNKSVGGKNKTHGFGHEDRLFRIWAGILTRTIHQNTDPSRHKSYVRNKVTICKKWEKDFMAFREWALAHAYKDTLVLDKDLICECKEISPKIYSPDTCVWITQSINNKIRAMSKEDKLLLLEQVNQQKE